MCIIIYHNIISHIYIYIYAFIIIDLRRESILISRVYILKMIENKSKQLDSDHNAIFKYLYTIIIITVLLLRFILSLNFFSEGSFINDFFFEREENFFYNF